MDRIQSLTTVETRTDSRAGEAQAQVSLQTLAHHIDIDWMREALRQVRKDGATGVDGQTMKSTRRI